jgi:hypothetical protein
MKHRRAVGIGCLVFGILNVIGFASPLLPAIGAEALLLAVLCFTLAYRFLRKEGEERIGSRPRFAELLSSRKRERAEEERRRIDPLLPVRVLKLAEKRGGTLTVSAVAMDLEVGLDDAQAALDELVRKAAASAEVDLGTGVTSYRFPEFLPRPEEPRGES